MSVVAGAAGDQRRHLRAGVAFDQSANYRLSHSLSFFMCIFLSVVSCDSASLSLFSFPPLFLPLRAVSA